jgi:hypothetical protein
VAARKPIGRLSSEPRQRRAIDRMGRLLSTFTNELGTY